MNHNTCHAIGAGIGLAFEAAEASDSPNSPESWVWFCLKAAEEAHAAAMENPPPIARGPVARLLHELDEQEGIVEDEKEDARNEPAARQAANDAAGWAYRCCMPRLTGRKMVQAYIACVAAGVQHKYFSGSEATSLLYTAQLALAAYPSRRAKRG